GVAVPREERILEKDRRALSEQARKVAATEFSRRHASHQGAAPPPAEALPGEKPEHLVAEVGLRQEDRAADSDAVLIQPEGRLAEAVPIREELVGIELVVAHVLVDGPVQVAGAGLHHHADVGAYGAAEL